MEEPLILIVMPVYNTGQYLTRAINSILNQTYTNFSFLIIDDGSTDNSLEILNSYSDSRMKIWTQNNSGPGVAMNRGIDFAYEEGIPYIARMDSDDISLPRRLEKQISLFLKRPNIVACSANSYYINENDRIIGSSTVPKSSKIIKFEINRNLRGLIQGCSMFKTYAIHSINGYRSTFPLAEEVDLFLRLAEKYELGNCSDFLYQIRLRNESLSISKFDKNFLYSMYAINCAERRKKRKPEIRFDDFTSSMSYWKSLNYKRIFFALKLWHNGIKTKSPLKLLIASLIEPKRVVARLIRYFDTIN